MQMYAEVDAMGMLSWIRVMIKRNNLLSKMQLHLG